MPTILVIRHVPHEGLGALEAPLTRAGFRLRGLNAADPKAAWPADPSAFDGLIVLGGPQSVYEQAASPYLARDLALLRQTLNANKPVLGICLGRSCWRRRWGPRCPRIRKRKSAGIH